MGVAGEVLLGGPVPTWMAWGPAWVDGGYVFRQENGEPIHPRPTRPRSGTPSRGPGCR